jgi:glyoxylase-like metal-dependent hydrolase (beta-lactamase superfamily II)
VSEVDVERILAPNPGPMSLEGTNSYVVGRDPAVVIDPGPEDSGHIDAVRAAGEERGGIETVLVTHGHSDHTGGVELLGIEPARPADGEIVGGLRAIATPGHARDHLCFLLEPPEPAASGAGVCFTGDLILGEGSSIVPTRELGGSLADYMDSLRRLAQLDLDLLLPGHGPRIERAREKISEYLEHRADRQRRLEAALDRGERSRAALVAEVWDDVPEQLRPAAAVALQAHLEMLEDEGRLPPDLRD